MVNSPIGGLLGEYDCGTNCTVANDCSDCGPSTAPVLTSQGYQTCSAPVGMSGTLYTVYRDTNSFSSTYNNYYVNNVDVGATAPASGNADANWTNVGGPFCSSCVAYQPQRDTNPCSPTYNDERNLSLGATAPCNYAANWVNNGSTFCSDCVAYQPEIDNNPCSATYNNTRNTSLGATEPCNYNATWENRDPNVYYVCVGVDKYYQQIDTNPCSPTYNTTQTGGLYQNNSVDCGYEPPTNYTITWSNNSITTGTNQLEILKNGIQIVYVGGLANGSFSVNSSDVITYNLASSTPNYTYVLISVNTGGTGTVSDCNYSSAYVVESGGITFNANGTIDGITIDYIDGCP